MAVLARLSRDRDLDPGSFRRSHGLPMGVGQPARARHDVLVPGPRHRHPPARAADAALARGALSRLPVAHQPFLSLAASQGSNAMSVVSIVGTAERVPLPDAV